MQQPAFASSIITGPIVSSAISDTGAAMDLDRGRDQVLLQGRGRALDIALAPALALEAVRVEAAEEDQVLQADRSPGCPDRDQVQGPPVLDRVRLAAAPALLVLAPDQAPLVLDQVLPVLDRALSARAMERDRAPDTD